MSAFALLACMAFQLVMVASAINSLARVERAKRAIRAALADIEQRADELAQRRDELGALLDRAWLMGEAGIELEADEAPAPWGARPIGSITLGPGPIAPIVTPATSGGGPTGGGGGSKPAGDRPE